MITRNMKAILMPGNSMSTCANIGFILKPQDPYDPFETTANDYINAILYRMHIVVGSGTTPATFNDLSMEQPINNLTVVSQLNGNATQRSDRSYARNIVSTYSATFKNNTSSPITVNEIGLVSEIPGFDYVFLFDREILDEPKKIEPNKSCTFTITLG